MDMVIVFHSFLQLSVPRFWDRFCESFLDTPCDTQIGTFDRKVVKKRPQMAPQSDPEAIQMDMGRPFETYGIYCLGNKVDHKEWHRKLNFSLLAALGVFFYWFCTAFLDFGAKRVSKMD